VSKWMKRAEKAGISFMIYPIIPMKRYWEGVRRIIGDDGEAVLAYETGKEAVKELIRLVRKEFKLEGEDLLKAMIELFSELKMGKMNMVYPIRGLEAGEIVIKVEDSYIARCLYERSERPVCNLIGGEIAGLLEELTGWKIDAEETKCLAMGDKYCEFVASRVQPAP